MPIKHEHGDRGTLQHATAQRPITKDSCIHELYISTKKVLPPLGLRVLGYVPARRCWFVMYRTESAWSTGFSEYSRNEVSHWIDIREIPAPRSKGAKNG